MKYHNIQCNCIWFGILTATVKTGLLICVILLNTAFVNQVF